MPYSDRSMLTDADGNLIPQVYDPTTDDFAPLTGTVAGLNARLTEVLKPALGEGAVVVPTTPSDLTAPAGAAALSLQVQGGTIRFKTSGTAATPTEGQLAPAYSNIRMSVAEAANFTTAVVDGTPSLWAVWL